MAAIEDAGPGLNLDAVRSQFDQTFGAIKTIIEENNTFQKKLNDTALDLEDSIHQRRSLQVQVAALQKELAHARAKVHPEKVTNNTYDLILLDGDGMHFTPDLIQSGNAGGSKAAHRLYKMARNIMPQVNDSSELIIRVFANVDGLAKALKRSNIISDTNTLREFTIGFTQAQHQTNFIDVGSGKEGADEKLKSELRWNLKNSHCRHIMFGVSHDNGYVPSLKSISAEPGALNKVILLEAIPFGKPFAELQYRKVRFPPALFTNVKLTPEDMSIGASGSPPKYESLSPNPAVDEILFRINHGIVNSPPPSTPPLSVSDTGAPPIHIGPMDALVECIKKLSPKPCNNFYILNNCKYSPCTYSHYYTFDETGVNAMKQLAATVPCKFGTGCKNERCYRGHPQTHNAMVD